MKRDTRQRDAVYKVLVDSGRPLSVSEILEQAQSAVTGIGIATVYRNLKTLHEEGKVVPVDLPGHPPRWEIVPEGHHHHFLCNTCDKLFKIHGCPQGLTSLLPKGYTLAEHEILLRGQCDACAKKTSLTNVPQTVTK